DAGARGLRTVWSGRGLVTSSCPGQGRAGRGPRLCSRPGSGAGAPRPRAAAAVPVLSAEIVGDGVGRAGAVPRSGELCGCRRREGGTGGGAGRGFAGEEGPEF